MTDIPEILTEPVPDVTPSIAIEPEGKKTIVLAGFWGRGNAGDEAMLQCIIETLGPEFEYTMSVDERGARDGFWDWYPYVGRQIVHQADADIFNRVKRPAGILVGGGGLPIGFAGGQVTAARARDFRVAMAGVDLWGGRGDPTSAMAKEMLRDLSGLDACYVRTTTAYESTKRSGCSKHVRLGADWALNLPTDGSPEVSNQKGRCLVVLREDDINNVPSDFKEQVRRLLDAISEQGYVPFFLPFSPEDDTFLDATGVRGMAPVEVYWSNARRLKQLIASSGLTVSVGRLHPVIFAATTGRPVACIHAPHKEGRLSGKKLERMCLDLGIDMHANIDGFIASLPGGVNPANDLKVAVAKARLNVQADHLRRLFAGTYTGPDKGLAEAVDVAVKRLAAAEAAATRLLSLDQGATSLLGRAGSTMFNLADS